MVQHYPRLRLSLACTVCLSVPACRARGTHDGAFACRKSRRRGRPRSSGVNVPVELPMLSSGWSVYLGYSTPRRPFTPELVGGDEKASGCSSASASVNCVKPNLGVQTKLSYPALLVGQSAPCSFFYLFWWCANYAALFLMPHAGNTLIVSRFHSRQVTKLVQAWVTGARDQRDGSGLCGTRRGLAVECCKPLPMYW